MKIKKPVKTVREEEVKVSEKEKKAFNDYIQELSWYKANMSFEEICKALEYQIEDDFSSMYSGINEIAYCEDVFEVLQNFVDAMQEHEFFDDGLEDYYFKREYADTWLEYLKEVLGDREPAKSPDSQNHLELKEVYFFFYQATDDIRATDSEGYDSDYSLELTEWKKSSYYSNLEECYSQWKQAKTVTTSNLFGTRFEEIDESLVSPIMKGFTDNPNNN